MQSFLCYIQTQTTTQVTAKLFALHANAKPWFKLKYSVCNSSFINNFYQQWKIMETLKQCHAPTIGAEIIRSCLVIPSRLKKSTYKWQKLSRSVFHPVLLLNQIATKLVIFTISLNGSLVFTALDARYSKISNQ